MPNRPIKIFPSIPALAEEAARRIVTLANQAIDQHGGFSIALSGGTTPKVLYQRLAEEPYCSQIDWTKVHVFFGDERCVPPDHADSNHRMADEAMLSKLPIVPANVHRMRGELEPAQAAAEYDSLLFTRFPHGGLDLVLLGMGDDGHTASLFPGTAALGETRHRAVANHVPKLNAWRITMTAPFINAARHVTILIAGASKARRLHEVLEGPDDPLRLPIQLVKPSSGNLTWFLDTEAGGML